LDDDGKIRAAPSPPPPSRSPVTSDSRAALLAKAAALLVDVVAADSDGSFRGDETLLAKALADAGREASESLLRKHLEPQPDEVLIGGVRYRRVLDGADVAGPGGGRCCVGSPFGTLTIARALYREVGQRGVKGATTLGLLEQRAGIINGLTPRMAELATFYDAIVPSRESERLTDLRHHRRDGRSESGLNRSLADSIGVAEPKM
jgi:hypothetical protein